MGRYAHHIIVPYLSYVMPREIVNVFVSAVAATATAVCVCHHRAVIIHSAYDTTAFSYKFAVYEKSVQYFVYASIFLTWHIRTGLCTGILHIIFMAPYVAHPAHKCPI